jgi:hypothetical protein
VFEGKIDANSLEKWLNLLKGYYSIQKFSDNEKITFALLKSLPHVKYCWEGYCERHNDDESMVFGTRPTWETFVDSLKNELHLVGINNNQYLRWTTLH